MSALYKLHWAVRDALIAVGLPVAVIGIDVSFNEHLTADFRPHWMLHPRVFVPGMLCKSEERTLRTHFPSGDLVSRPLKVATFDGDLAGIAYGMKSRFKRRQSYQQVKPRTEGTRRCRNTRGRPLRGSEAVELAVFLNQVGLRRRLILQGAVLKRNCDGAVVIRPDCRPFKPGPSFGR